MSLEQQVANHEMAIRELQQSQQKLERDYETLYTLWKTQNDSIKELKDDIKGDMASMKQDLRGDIKELGEKHDDEVKLAHERWPKRAHFIFEAMLATVAALEYIQHMHGW